MQFVNEALEVFDHTQFEREEQKQAELYITPECKVLELGARYGTVSCIISKKLNNNGKLVVVEPDSRVWKALHKNMQANDCSFNIVEGFISKEPRKLINLDSWDGYAASSRPAETSEIPHYTLIQIQAKYGFEFDTLVADCEGFLGIFFEENEFMYDQLKLILFEQDEVCYCDYEPIKKKLEEKGFINIESGFHEVWKK